MRRRGAPGFGTSCGSGFGLRGRNILPQKWIELAPPYSSCRNLGRRCRLRARSRNVALGRRLLPTSRERQANRKAGALSRGGFHRDLTAVALDDAKGNAQAQAVAFLSLGGEERLKQTLAR